MDDLIRRLLWIISSTIGQSEMSMKKIFCTICVLTMFFFSSCAEDDPEYVYFPVLLENLTEDDVYYCVAWNGDEQCSVLASKSILSLEDTVRTLIMQNKNCCADFGITSFKSANDSSLEVETKELSSEYNDDWGKTMVFVHAMFKSAD